MRPSAHLAKKVRKRRLEDFRERPCDFTSSPVASNIFRFSHPNAPGPCTPLETHSVLLASSAKIRWWVGKHVEISVNLPLAGSYIERRRPVLSSGDILADGWSCLQKSGLAVGRTRAPCQTRPFSSIIWWWMLVWLSQIGSGSQYGEGAMGFALEDGVFGSRTGCFTCVAVCVFGSSTGK